MLGTGAVISGTCVHLESSAVSVSRVCGMCVWYGCVRYVHPCMGVCGMYTHVCVCTYVCTHMYVCVRYVHTCMCVCGMYTHVCVCAVCTHMYVCVRYVHTCMCVCGMYTHVCVCAVCTHMYVCVRYVHTHTCIFVYGVCNMHMCGHVPFMCVVCVIVQRVCRVCVHDVYV